MGRSVADLRGRKGPALSKTDATERRGPFLCKSLTEPWRPGILFASFNAPHSLSTSDRQEGDMTSKNRICLWYDGTAADAARFYAETFPNSSLGAVQRAPGDYPDGKQGDVLIVAFTVMGIPCIGLNGGAAFKHSEAFSFQVATDDQAETDRLWNAIVRNGGQESDCGWCKDKWGLSWQITPRALTDGLADPDRKAAKRVFDAMMQMKKIDVAAIEAARRG
jgi:predicted 3-demethylubiquinone-9 3-methyltransferase (glyoxalase superfamily)